MGKADGRMDHQPVTAIIDHDFDEALVDLDLAGRDLLQIVEGRQAGFFFSRRRRHTRCLSAWSSDVCSSDLVFDVGVGWGTPELYEAFPQARHILVEPLVEYEPAIQQILDRYDADWVRAAAGAEAGGGSKIGRASCRARVVIVAGASVESKAR